MPRRAFFWTGALAGVVGAVVAVANSMAIVNDAMCGTPRSFEACYQPVLVPSVLGALAFTALGLVVVGLVKRRRASVAVLLGAAGLGIIVASPVLARAHASDGCNQISGYLPRVLAPHAEWLAAHDVIEPSGGYETLMNCFAPPSLG